MVNITLRLIPPCNNIIVYLWLGKSWLFYCICFCHDFKVKKCKLFDLFIVNKLQEKKLENYPHSTLSRVEQKSCPHTGCLKICISALISCSFYPTGWIFMSSMQQRWFWGKHVTLWWLWWQLSYLLFDSAISFCSSGRLEVSKMCCWG